MKAIPALLLLVAIAASPFAFGDDTPAIWKTTLTGTDNIIGLHRRLTIEVKPPANPNPVSRLDLMYDGVALSSVAFNPARAPSGPLVYEFLLDDRTRPVWARLFSKDPQSVQLNVQATFTNNEVATIGTIEVTLPPRGFKTVVSVGLVIVIIVAVLWLGAKSNLLRDTGGAPATAKPPFSLARCQMAVWTVAVIWAFLYIWQHVGDTPVISSSVLGLIGIASGTALGAGLIGANKRSDDLQKVVEAQGKLTQLAATPGILPQQLADLRTEIARLQSRLAPQSSSGLLNDIMSDNDGISFHRFQLVAWTVVLVVVFLFETVGTLQIHEFDNTLLALMGISSGTYLGFKIPE